MTLINALFREDENSSNDSQYKERNLPKDKTEEIDMSEVTEKNIFESYENRREQKNTGSRGTVSSGSSISGLAYVNREQDDINEPASPQNNSLNDTSVKLIQTDDSPDKNVQHFKKLMASLGGSLKILRKKNIVIVSAMLLVCCALILNQMLFADNTSTPVDEDNIISSNADNENNSADAEMDADSSSDAYFASAAVNRKRARDESLEVLEMVVQSEEALQESKDNALNSMAKIASQIEQEANIESLIEAKGFSDCVAIVSDNSATVVVSSDDLLANQIAQITEIVCEQTALPATVIKIIEKPAA